MKARRAEETTHPLPSDGWWRDNKRTTFIKRYNGKEIVENYDRQRTKGTPDIEKIFSCFILMISIL